MSTEVDPGIPHCPRCHLPAHASVTNDDGVCLDCLGDEAVYPEADDRRADDDGMAQPFHDSDDSDDGIFGRFAFDFGGEA